MIVMTSMIKLESLFGPLFDEYFNEENQVVSKSSTVTNSDASDKRQQQPDSTSSTSTLATTMNENKGIMPTKVELTPEQSQQGVSDDVLNIGVILFSIHSDDGNPSSVIIKQHCGGAITTLSGKPMTKRDQRVKRKLEKLMILCSIMLLPLNRSPLGAVTNIIQEAKENANAFEEVAASLKRDKAQAKSQAMRGDDAGPQMEPESLVTVGRFQGSRLASGPAPSPYQPKGSHGMDTKPDKLPNAVGLILSP
ncbi:hypothetical protein Tco_0647648 [Tanacetum coccineum]